MARYRALGPIYIKRLIDAGQEFESELTPGRNWEPLDDEARAAVAAYREKRHAVLQIAEQRDPMPAKMSAVEIPADWETMTGAKRRGLAMRLGAPGTVTKEDANSFIVAELERRKHKAA